MTLVVVVPLLALLSVSSPHGHDASFFGGAGVSPLMPVNGRASGGEDSRVSTRLHDALRLRCWLLCKASATHGPSSGCGLGNVLPFGCSNTIVADLGGLKLFVYGGEDSGALASNGNRKMMRVEGLPCGAVA